MAVVGCRKKLIKLVTGTQQRFHDDLVVKLQKRLKLTGEDWDRWYRGFVDQCLNVDQVKTSSEMRKLIAALLARYKQEMNRAKTDPVLLKKIWCLARNNGITEDTLRSMVSTLSGQTSTKLLPYWQAIELCNALETGRPVKKGVQKRKGGK